jgi:HEAT repeat protein
VSRRSRKATTAKELLAELEADPGWVAARNEEERKRQERSAEWRRAEEPLVRDLYSTGYRVESAWDLVNTATPYPEALPILLEHLKRPYPDRVREGIARALAVRGDAKFAWSTLVDLYRAEPAGTDTKDGLAVALAAVADREVLDELIALAEDRKNGESRILLLRGLTRSRRDEARAAVERLQDDPEVGPEARQRVRERRRS